MHNNDQNKPVSDSEQSLPSRKLFYEMLLTMTETQKKQLEQFETMVKAWEGTLKKLQTEFESFVGSAGPDIISKLLDLTGKLAECEKRSKESRTLFEQLGSLIQTQSKQIREIARIAESATKFEIELSSQRSLFAAKIGTLEESATSLKTFVESELTTLLRDVIQDIVRSEVRYAIAMESPKSTCANSSNLSMAIWPSLVANLTTDCSKALATIRADQEKVLKDLKTHEDTQTLFKATLKSLQGTQTSLKTEMNELRTLLLKGLDSIHKQLPSSEP